MPCLNFLPRLLAGVTATAIPFAVLCQTPHDAPSRIIVPVAPGGSSDVVARVLAEKLSNTFTQPFIVENKAGGGGVPAAELLKHAAPDGKTLLLAPIAVSVLAPLVRKHPGFDPAQDFAPISQVSGYSYAFAVRIDHPARTIVEFAAWAKAHPEQASFATGGVGSIAHFLGTEINRAAGIDMVHVPYASFAEQGMALEGGHVTASIDAVPNLIARLRAGKIRVLSTTGAERSPLLPAVPTFREQGYPAIEAVGWNAVYAPARTPRLVIDRLSAAIVQTMQLREVRQKFIDLGMEPTGTTPEALAARMAADTARWSAIVKGSGFTAE